MNFQTNCHQFVLGEQMALLKIIVFDRGQPAYSHLLAGE